MNTQFNFAASIKFGLLIILSILSLHSIAAEEYVFTAPPRETPEKGEETYGAITTFLSSVLNKKIVYKHSGNWLAYSMDMRNDKYDIVFDGPHFVSWRIARLKHIPVVKIPGDFIFRFLADKNNNNVSTVEDLVGKRVCGHPPPNQGTLRLYNELKNPMRLPILVPVKGWRNIYEAMIKGQCDAAIVPDKIYKKVDPKGEQSKVLFTSKPVSGQAITVGPRFTQAEIVKIRDALLSEKGKAATAALRKRFASPILTPATIEEYNDVYRLLAYSHGFDVD